LWRSYVGLTFGCVSMLDAVWRLLLRSDHLLRHLHNGEKHEQLRHDIQTTFHLCVVGNDRAEVPDSYFEQLKTSADPVRAELSYRLFKRSLLFLYYHELSHLGRGHPNLCHATGSQPVILEANGGIGDQPIVSNGRPWAEHEADWLATIWLLQNEERLPDEGQNIEILVEMFIAVGVVFVIFSLAEEKLGRLSVDHPHPSLRLAHLVEESAEFLVAGERYPFQDLGPIQIAAERALEELAIVGVLAGFDWYQSAEKETSRGKEQITSTRLSAGREWVEAANQAMRKIPFRVFSSQCEPHPYHS